MSVPSASQESSGEMPIKPDWEYRYAEECEGSVLAEVLRDGSIFVYDIPPVLLDGATGKKTGRYCDMILVMNAMYVAQGWEPLVGVDGVTPEKLRKAIRKLRPIKGWSVVTSECDFGNLLIVPCRSSFGTKVSVFCCRKFRKIEEWTCGGVVVAIKGSQVRDFFFLILRSFSTCPTYYIEKVEAKTGRVHFLLQLYSDTSTTDNPSVALDATGDCAAVADKHCLRLWYTSPLQQDSTIELPEYESPGPVCSCSISDDAGIVVAAMAGNRACVWDAKERVRIATLSGHSSLVSHVSISSCGSQIVTACRDKHVRAFSRVTTTGNDQSNPPGEVPQPGKSLSSLECALATALAVTSSNQLVVTEEFVKSSIRSEHVKSASDLLAGHNIVLLAIRTGVLRRDNIRGFGGTGWYFQENLYLPACKLTQDNADLIDTVFRHAESVGIIADGIPFKVAREMRTYVDRQMGQVHSVLVQLAESVVSIDSRVYSLELQSSNLKDAFNALYRNQQQLQRDVLNNQQQVQRAVVNLSNSLTTLKSHLAKNERRMKYATCAKMLLTLVPVAGNFLGAALVSAAAFDAFDAGAGPDLLQLGVEGAKEIMSQAAGVDLSNFHLAGYAFSEANLSKLAAPARSALTKAVQESAFSSLSELRDSLSRTIANNRKEDNRVALIDLASSEWMNGKSKGSKENAEDSLDKKCRHCFQYATSHEPGERNVLSIEEANGCLNRLLRDCGIKGVDKNKIEDIFIDITGGKAMMVSEQVFMEMFSVIREQYRNSRVHRELMTEAVKQFRSAARPKNALSKKMAAVVVANVQKEFVDHGKLQDKGEAPLDQFVERLRKFDKDKNNLIDEQEFVNAIRKLFFSDAGL